MARLWGSPVLVAPGVYSYLRPVSVQAIVGTVIGTGLDTALYPYDPNPVLQGKLATDGVSVDGTVGLTFAPSAPSEGVALGLRSSVSQVLVVYLRGTLTLAPGSGFTQAVGYPHSLGLTGRYQSLFALRWAYDADQQLRLVGEGATIVCVLGVARVQW